MVGAGVGGLAAAARLAALGHHVTVCEQAPEVGGKLGRVVHDGAAGAFGFDTGPSLVTMPQVFRELFRDTGDSLDSVLPLRRTTLPRASFADGAVLPTATTEADFLDGLDPGQRLQWRRFLARAERIWDATHAPFLESPLGSARALLRLLPGQLRDLRTVAPWRSLGSLGASLLPDSHLRMLLDRYATYTGSDPRRAPAALAVVPFVEQRFGAWYVDGGLHRLGLAIRDRAAERGAVLRTDTDVVAVETAGGRVGGVRLADGSRLAADVVVANADAAHVYGDLLPRSRATTRLAHRVTARASYSGFVVLLALRGATPGLAHHEVLFPADYEAEFDGLRAGTTPLPDPAVYVSAPRDPGVAPPGHESWFVLVNAPRHAPSAAAGGMDWEAAGVVPAYADRVLDLLAARGLDVRSRVVWRGTRSPADLERATRAVGGAIYGTSSDGARAAFVRPANRSPVPGLFLVGGSAHPGGGLPLVTLSARIVAGLVGPA